VFMMCVCVSVCLCACVHACMCVCVHEWRHPIHAGSSQGGKMFVCLVMQVPNSHSLGLFGIQQTIAENYTNTHTNAEIHMYKCRHTQPSQGVSGRRPKHTHTQADTHGTHTHLDGDLLKCLEHHKDIHTQAHARTHAHLDGDLLECLEHRIPLCSAQALEHEARRHRSFQGELLLPLQ